MEMIKTLLILIVTTCFIPVESFEEDDENLEVLDQLSFLDDEYSDYDDHADPVCGEGRSKIVASIADGRVKVDHLGQQEILSYAMRNEILDCLHIIEDSSILRSLFSRLPPLILSQLASRPGLLENMSDQAIITFADNQEALELTPPEVLLNLANQRPRVIALLPAPALVSFINRPEFLSGLAFKTKLHLVYSKFMAEKLMQLPKESILQVIVTMPSLLYLLPASGNYPARPFVQRLIMDKEFLRDIPIEIHAQLAESNFRHQLSQTDVLKILSVHPKLPKVLSPRGMELNRHYLRNHTFLDRMPCTVYLGLANDFQFLDTLTPNDLKFLSNSKRMWRCLPVSMIRTMMKESNVGQRIGFTDILTAATIMYRDRILDKNIVANVFRYQLPNVAKSILSERTTDLANRFYGRS